MKSKLFLTVLLLAAITTIGISQDKQSQSTKLDKAAKAEEDRIAKLPLDVQSLVGVESIYILTEVFREDAKSTGLTVEQLKADIESKLRLAGIKVNSIEEMYATEDGSCLNASVDTESNDDSFSCTVRLSFGQSVYLMRKPHRRCVGVTWEKFTMGRCSRSLFPEKARQTVKGMTDKFIEDNFTANPKKEPQASKHHQPSRSSPKREGPDYLF